MRRWGFCWRDFPCGGCGTNRVPCPIELDLVRTMNLYWMILDEKPELEISGRGGTFDLKRNLLGIHLGALYGRQEVLFVSLRDRILWVNRQRAVVTFQRFQNLA